MTENTLLFSIGGKQVVRNRHVERERVEEDCFEADGIGCP